VPSNLSINGHSFRRVLTPRRRRWSVAEKVSIVAESQAPGAQASAIALRYGLHRNQLYGWRREFGSGVVAKRDRRGRPARPRLRPGGGGWPVVARRRSRSAARACVSGRGGRSGLTRQGAAAVEGDEMIPRPLRHTAGGGARADRDAAGRLPPRRRWPGGDSAIGAAAGPVQRDDLRVPLKLDSPRPPSTSVRPTARPFSIVAGGTSRCYEARRRGMCLRAIQPPLATAATISCEYPSLLSNSTPQLERLWIT
jgi:transposase-like protein